MSITAFILLLLSVSFHASWNLLAKKSSMSTAYYTAIGVTAMLCVLNVQFWTPVKVLDMPPEFFLFTLCSVSSDILYCLGLGLAYRSMEMSTAYPMMRSLPLLLTAAVTAVFGLGTPFSATAMCGMGVIFVGCLLMPMSSFSNFRIKDYINSKLLFVFIVACGTTGYTIFDSLAQQVMRSAVTGISKPVMALTYYSSRGICLCSALLLIVFSVRSEREKFLDFFKQRNYTPVLAGVFAAFAYGLVLMAMGYVSNVSYVQAFRQLGLLIGVAAGILILKERCSAPKIIGSILIVSGLLMTL